MPRSLGKKLRGASVVMAGLSRQAAPRIVLTGYVRAAEDDGYVELAAAGQPEIWAALPVSAIDAVYPAWVPTPETGDASLLAHVVLKAPRTAEGKVFASLAHPVWAAGPPAAATIVPPPPTGRCPVGERWAWDPGADGWICVPRA